MLGSINFIIRPDEAGLVVKVLCQDVFVIGIDRRITKGRNRTAYRSTQRGNGDA